MEMIRVKPTASPNPDGSGPVIAALFDAGQPNEALFIAVGVDKTGQQVEYDVAKSPLVTKLLADNLIAEVKKEEPTPDDAASKRTASQRSSTK